MAAGGLLLLLDDIATALDDVAVMSKVAIKKTAGIIGDDLAVGAGSVSSNDPSRELPVVWAVAKGSFINKLYLVPGALLLNALAPFLIKPLLMAGGAFFCYEAVEKVSHLRESRKVIRSEKGEAEKIRGAINTDMILSAEIVTVALGSVATAPFATQAIVLCSLGVLMTVGIYGLVALIVKLDDIGLHLLGKRRKTARLLGRFLVRAAPVVMKILSVVGTAAMLVVGGGLVLHGIPAVEDALDDASGFGKTVVAALAGGVVGFAALPIVKLAGLAMKKIFPAGGRRKEKKKT